MSDARNQESPRANFSSLLSPNPIKRSQLQTLIEKANQAGGTYHRLDFGDGLDLVGDYDMARYVQHFSMPDSLAGCKVLDVGTAAGYFSLEAARRGAEVTAIDVHDAYLFNCILPSLTANIRYQQKDLYTLDAGFGQFDLVIFGSVLLHLPDPLGALRAIRRVCTKRLIVATACTADSETNPSPICVFRGQKAVDGDYWHYWSISAPALRGMLLAAGFSRVEQEHHFTMRTEPGRADYADPHVVMSAYV